MIHGAQTARSLCHFTLTAGPPARAPVRRAPVLRDRSRRQPAVAKAGNLGRSGWRGKKGAGTTLTFGEGEKRRSRSAARTKRSTIRTAASTLALSRGRRTRVGRIDA